MRALEVFAIYVTPFLIIGVAIRFLMKRYAVDLPDVEKQTGPKPRRNFSWEFGAPKIKAASAGSLFHSRTESKNPTLRVSSELIVRLWRMNKF